MKAKLLVFFGIVLLGTLISVFSLTKCEKAKGTGGNSVIAATDSGGKGTTGGAKDGEKSASPVTDNEKNAVNPTPAVPPKPVVDTPQTTDKPAAKPPKPESMAAVEGKPKPDPSSKDAEPYKAGTKAPEGMVGDIANKVQGKDFDGVMAITNDASIPESVRNKLKSLVENPDYELDPRKPFSEIAKTKDSVRWIMNFVPKGSGSNAESETVVIDIKKQSDESYQVSNVGFKESVSEVIKALNGESTGVTLDALTIAQAFSEAVLGEDFVSARKLASPQITDERIAGLMIALEDGHFRLREERPLVMTFSREDIMALILTRVNSPIQSSEFALTLENNANWNVKELTFGKVIASLAKDVEGPYSPIVEDPAGGESLVIYFDFDNSGLTSRADNQLKIVANILKQDLNRKIRITGHADALGDEDYNSALSKKRAEAIRDGIIARGALPSQVITEGFGETKPRKPNFKEDGSDNPTGRSLNRRGEVYLDF